jgi:hypothetical protein
MKVIWSGQQRQKYREFKDWDKQKVDQLIAVLERLSEELEISSSSTTLFLQSASESGRETQV